MEKKMINYYDIERNLQVAINNGKVIRLISYSMSTDVEKKLDKVIHSILEKYDKVDLKSLIYTSVKELAINGTKANLKRVFFEEQGLEIANEDDYEKGMVLYKDQMTEEKAMEFGKKARESGLFVRISFFHDDTGLRIEVINNTSITPQEEKRLREKLSKIMQYDNLMEFYMDNQDNTEGAGMGLALVTTMLKGEQVDPNLFRIMTNEEKTIARVEIPFSEEFNSMRNKGENARKDDEISELEEDEASE